MSTKLQSTLLTEDNSIELTGVLEKVIFYNQENGYVVFSFLPNNLSKDVHASSNNLDTRGLMDRAQNKNITCTAYTALNLRLGMNLTLSGRWVNHQRYGMQFQCTKLDEILPATTDGMRAYLSSGLIKGIGASMADKIIETFGEKTLEILDNDPERLLQVQGVGKKKLAQILESWTNSSDVRQLAIFLQPYGISSAYVVKIHNRYKEAALQIVRQNPYRLAMDIRGIGFLTADAIATKLGFDKNNLLRIQAGVIYIMRQAMLNSGHVFLPKDVVVQTSCEQLGVEADLVIQAIKTLEETKHLICEEMPYSEDLAEISGIAVYLKSWYDCEVNTAFYMQRLSKYPSAIKIENASSKAKEIATSLALQLATEQLEAICAATDHKIMVLTGGPGTGKTTIIKIILQIFKETSAKILLAAPTGRAAKRMKEATNHHAATIHRLLEFSQQNFDFVRNEDNPLVCDLLIVDEVSMLDIMLFQQLLRAIPVSARVIFVGDANQLPSVGPGNVLADLIKSHAVPVVELTEIFRQSEDSNIISNAHKINHGIMPSLYADPKHLSDFYFIERDEAEDAASLMVELVCSRIPQRFNFDPVTEVQVLSPMQRGSTGVLAMNHLLQERLNPNAIEITKGIYKYRLYDKVMQIRNNYDRNVFNGDIGRIVFLDAQKRELSVDFDGWNVTYDFEGIDELVPAYAISIHKSQGSEYPAVVIPLLMQHYVMLKRNLVYTAVTRGKSLVVIVGQAKALGMAIRNDKTNLRYSRLLQRLQHIKIN